MRKQLKVLLQQQTGIAPVVVVILLGVGLVVALMAIRQTVGTNSKAAPQTTVVSSPKPVATTGSGAPSGAHYNLNLIGVPKGKTADLTGSSGHRIFVPLDGNCKINLSLGDFSVLDGNCTDGPAEFQLPNPDPENDGVTVYSVYARALGKPGGSSKTTTCATDPTTGEVYCSTEAMVLVRGTGKSSFSNVSKQLLYIYADLDGDGVTERYPLFDDRLSDYFWNYDNNGLKLAQLRFYQVSTNVNP